MIKYTMIGASRFVEATDRAADRSGFARGFASARICISRDIYWFIGVTSFGIDGTTPIVLIFLFIFFFIAIHASNIILVVGVSRMVHVGGNKKCQGKDSWGVLDIERRESVLAIRGRASECGHASNNIDFRFSPVIWIFFFFWIVDLMDLYFTQAVLLYILL